MNFDPKEDGITHINMFSRGKTELGRMLSNFYRYPINTKDGQFMSVEGYWQWLCTPEYKDGRERLRSMYGYKAKSYGNELRHLTRDCVSMTPEEQYEFERKILTAIWYKFRRNADMITKDNYNLPIVHYYEFGCKVVNVTDKYPWMIDGIEKMRKALVEECDAI